MWNCFEVGLVGVESIFCRDYYLLNILFYDVFSKKCIVFFEFLCIYEEFSFSCILFIVCFLIFIMFNSNIEEFFRGVFFIFCF